MVPPRSPRLCLHIALHLHTLSRTQDVCCSFTSPPLTMRLSAYVADGTEGLDLRDHVTGAASPSTWT